MIQAGELGSQPLARFLHQAIPSAMCTPMTPAQLLQLHNCNFPGEFVAGFLSLPAAGKTM